MPIPQHFLEESFQIEAPSGYENTVRRAIASLLPDAKFGKGRKISVEVKSKEQSICVTVELEGLEGKKSYVDTERFAEDEKRLRTRERIRAGVFAVISLAYNIPPSPWGTLVGVRPTKLVHALYDEGKSKEDIANFLSDIYQVSKEKIDLLFQVADKQREFFHPSPKGPISVYLGIPFCPTRCGYCSSPPIHLKVMDICSGLLSSLLRNQRNWHVAKRSSRTCRVYLSWWRDPHYHKRSELRDFISISSRIFRRIVQRIHS